MERQPNTYKTLAKDEQALTPEVTVKDELTKFLTGENESLSKEAETSLRQTLGVHDAKAKLFMAAYGQKSIRRLARIMEAIDRVDDELLVPWRLKTMDSEDLISLMAELSSQQSKTMKEVLTIHDMAIDATKELETITKTGDSSVVKELSAQSRGKVLRFMDEHVIEERKDT